jgi:hypothetical protein
MAKCKVCGKQIPRGRIVCDECTETLRMRAPVASEVSMDTVQGNVLASMMSEQKEAEDIIGHPNHYCEGRKFEPKDVIRDWNLNFNLGNAVKYISRNGRKDGNSALQDLKKARQYLDFEIEYLEKGGK